MTQRKRSRPRATPGAKPNPAPAAQAPPGDVAPPGALPFVDLVGRFTIVPNAFIEDARLSNAAVRLWIYLRSYGSGNQATTVAYPKYKTIREALGWGSDTTVKHALDELIAAGWITRRRRFSSSSYYTLNPSSTESVEMAASSTESGELSLHKVENSSTESVEKQHQQKQDPQKPPPPRRPAGAQGGAGANGKNAPELAEILAMLKANELDTTTRHVKHLAAQIVQHAPSVAAAQAVIEAKTKNIKTGKPGNVAGVLYSRLRDMTPDDWKAATPAPAVTWRVIEDAE